VTEPAPTGAAAPHASTLPAAPADVADPPWQPTRRWELPVVIVLALALLLPMLWSYTLIDPWEGHYGEVARRMLEEDDWVKIQWQNEPYFRSKPAFAFWLMASSLRLHGLAADGGYSGEMVDSPLILWALRLPFALFGAFGLTMIFWMLAKLVSRRVAWIAFAVVGTTPFYFFIARQALTDMPMIATAMGAICCFILAVHAGERQLAPLWRRVNGYHFFLLALGLFLAAHLARIGYDFGHDPALGRGIKLAVFGRQLHPAPIATLPYLLGFAAFVFLTWKVWPTRTSRHVYMYWAYLLVGVSVLAKGPPGAFIVGVTCLLYVLMLGQWRLILRVCLPQGVLIFLLVAAPWHTAMVLKDGRPWVGEYFGHHWFKRVGEGVHAVNKAGEGTFRYFAREIALGMWPWIGLLPLAVAAALQRGVARVREDRVRLLCAIWGLFGFAFFCFVETKYHHYVAPAVPALGILCAFWLDDLLAGKVARSGLAIGLAVVIVLFVARDLVVEQEGLIELFIYRYDRAWPGGPPWSVDLSDHFLVFGLAFAVLLLGLAVSRLRRYAMVGLVATAVGFAFYAHSYYMSKAGPHWGQGALHATYYRLRQIHGVDIQYYGLRDLADDWGHGGRELAVDSRQPDGFAVGQPMTVHIEVVGVQEIDLGGRVSRFFGHTFWIAVDGAEVAKLSEWVERGRAQTPSPKRPWSQVNADRMIAWQLNWRGENFWQGGEVWGRTKDTQTVFIHTDNKQFLEYVNAPERRGRKFFVVTEANRASSLAGVLPTKTGKESVEILDTSCNKFTLLSFTL
jgi:4-amino-4-deoxy-L-arabinose transferase-like glycosyltransferase